MHEFEDVVLCEAVEISPAQPFEQLFELPVVPLGHRQDLLHRVPLFAVGRRVTGRRGDGQDEHINQLTALAQRTGTGVSRSNHRPRQTSHGHVLTVRRAHGRNRPVLCEVVAENIGSGLMRGRRGMIGARTAAVDQSHWHWQ